MGDGLLRHWRGGCALMVLSQHATQPAECFTEVAAHACRSSQIMCYQPKVVLVVPFLRRLKRRSKLAFGRGPFTHGNQAKAACVAALCSDRGVWFAQREGSIQITKGQLVVAVASRQCR